MGDSNEIIDKSGVIHLGKIARVIGSRDLVKELLENAIKAHKKVTVDFSGVEFISRGVAHEIVMHTIKHSNITLTNYNCDVCRMIKIVMNSLKTPRGWDCEGAC